MGKPETKTEREARLKLEAFNAQLAREIGARMPPGTGFALMMFTFGQGGAFAWCSNADRQDMIRMLAEAKANLERGA